MRFLKEIPPFPIESKIKRVMLKDAIPNQKNMKDEISSTLKMDLDKI